MDEFRGLKSRPETLGPGFFSCLYEDWHPSMEKRRRRGQLGFSYLDELPDEILAEILSRLEVKEAIRTRVVSRRLRNLCSTSSTTYDYESSSDYSIRYDEYASIGAKVVRYTKPASKKDFVILGFDKEKDCDISEDYSSLIKWIPTLLPRKRSVLLDTVNRLQKVRLTTLYLNSVSMSTYDLINRVRSCLSLQTLVVVNAQIGGALKEIIASAPNLETLKLTNPDHRIVITSGESEKLASVTLEGDFRLNLISMIQKAAPRAEKLELKMVDLIRGMSLTPSLHFPEFENLKDAKLIFHLGPNLNLTDLVLFTKACPNLQKLTLVYGYCSDDEDNDDQIIHYNARSDKSYEHHRNLQVVEFIGWRGHENEVQFANNVIKTASHLRDLIFYPFTPKHVDRFGARIFDRNLLRGGDSVKKALESARRLMEKFKTTKSYAGPKN